MVSQRNGVYLSTAAVMAALSHRKPAPLGI